MQIPSEECYTIDEGKTNKIYSAKLSMTQN